MIAKIATKWKALPSTWYVKCSICSLVEGTIVQNDNQWTLGIGFQADAARARGWRFESGEWLCPGC